MRIYKVKNNTQRGIKYIFLLSEMIMNSLSPIFLKTKEKKIVFTDQSAASFGNAVFSVFQ